MKEILSTSNKHIKMLSKLTSKKDILEQGLFLVEGRNLVIEAINYGIVEELLVTDPEMYSTMNVERTLVSEEVINKLSTNRSNRGAIAVCKYEPVSVNLSLVNKIIVLDGINNPGNLGTIIRTAVAFGFDAVVTLNESVFVYNDKTIRSAQGALFKMPVVKIDDLTKLKEFKSYKFLLSEDAAKLEDIAVNRNEKIALVFGNEANGISEEVINSLEGEDVMIDINDIESLNVAIAAGIAMNYFKGK